MFIVNRTFIFLILSLVCFIISWCITQDYFFHHSNYSSYLSGGFIFLVCSMLPYKPVQKIP